MTNEIDEPSYYEVALTNRQVLMAFIVILSAVLGSFLCGVWVGKGGAGPLQAQEVRAAEGGAQAAKEDDLESFRFFTDTDQEEEAVKKPDLSRLMEEPDKETTLAEDVGSRPNRKPASEPRKSSPPPKTQRPASAAPPPPAPAPAAAADDGFIVQVFSTHDEKQAEKVKSQVEAEGYPAFISPVDQPEGKFYRVRIGPFEEKARAERAARGIKQKFKLETWVTAATN